MVSMNRLHGPSMVAVKAKIYGVFYKQYSSTGWRPVVAVFCNILFSCIRHIVFSDSIFWFNKLGVNVGILLLYFFNRLKCVPVADPLNGSPRSIKL